MLRGINSLYKAVNLAYDIENFGLAGSIMKAAKAAEKALWDQELAYYQEVAAMIEALDIDGDA